MAFKTKALRNEKVVYVTPPEVVVGEIMLLVRGTRVPADGVLFESNDMWMDEGALWDRGEYVNKKCVTSPFVLAGSKVRSCPSSFL